MITAFRSRPWDGTPARSTGPTSLMLSLVAPARCRCRHRLRRSPTRRLSGDGFPSGHLARGAETVIDATEILAKHVGEQLRQVDCTSDTNVQCKRKLSVNDFRSHVPLAPPLDHPRIEIDNPVLLYARCEVETPLLAAITGGGTRRKHFDDKQRNRGVGPVLEARAGIARKDEEIGLTTCSPSSSSCRRPSSGSASSSSIDISCVAAMAIMCRFSRQGCKRTCERS